MDYPGYVIAAGAAADVVAAVAARLAALGYAVPAGQAQYDKALASTVRLFQSQHVDALGRPLVVDGKVGPMTWGALFGAPRVTTPPTGLAGAALGRAISQSACANSRSAPIAAPRWTCISNRRAHRSAAIGAWPSSIGASSMPPPISSGPTPFRAPPAVSMPGRR